MLHEFKTIIDSEHLKKESKGIYAGLVMVETKFCEVDEQQRAKHQPGKYPDDKGVAGACRIVLYSFARIPRFPTGREVEAPVCIKWLSDIPMRMWHYICVHNFLGLVKRH